MTNEEDGEVGRDMASTVRAHLCGDVLATARRKILEILVEMAAISELAARSGYAVGFDRVLQRNLWPRMFCQNTRGVVESQRAGTK